MPNTSWFPRHTCAQPRAGESQAHVYPPSTITLLPSQPVLQVNQMRLELPHAVFLSSERGTAVTAVTLAVGAEAGETCNVEKQQLWCWLGFTV